MRSNAVSEAGEGTTFQQRVSVQALCLLAAELEPPYADGLVREVSFQVSHTGVTTDDQMIVVEIAGSRRNHLLQCKRSVAFRRSDDSFQQFLSRAYKDIDAEYDDKTDLDLFVLVANYLANSHDFNEVLETARGCSDITILRKKLDNQAAHGMLAAIEGALAEGLGQALDEAKTLKLLRRIRVWESDLLNEPSKDLREIRAALALCTAGRSEDHAAQLIAQMHSVIGTKEARRYTYSKDLLRQEFRGLVARAAPNPAADYLSEEYIRDLSDRIKRLTARRLEGYTFEAYLELAELQKQELSKYQTQSGHTGQAAQSMQQLFCEIQRQTGAALLHMDARQTLLNSWVNEFRSLENPGPSLWELVGRIAVELDNTALLDESKSHLNAGQRAILEARVALRDENWKAALTCAEHISPEFEIDALMIRREAFLAQSYAKSEFALLAWDQAVRARDAAPTRLLLRIVAWKTGGVLLSHATSPFSFGNDTLPPLSWSEMVTGARRQIESLFHSGCGQFERSFAAHAYGSLLGDNERLDLGSMFDGLPAWMKLTKPSILLTFAAEAFNAGLKDIARDAIALVEDQDMTTPERLDCDRLASALSEEPQEYPTVPVPNPESDPLLDALNARSHFIASIVTADPRLNQFAAQVQELQFQHSIKLDVAVMQQFFIEDYKGAMESLREMRLSFPDAWRSWGILAQLLIDFFLDRLEGLKNKADYFSVGRASLNEQGRAAYDCCQIVFEHAATRLDNLVAWSNWLGLAQAVGDSSEFTSLAQAAAEADHEIIEHAALASDAYVNGRFEEAIASWNEAELLGQGLTARSRAYRDFARLRAGRYLDLADDAERLFLDSERQPSAAFPTVAALRVLGFPERALGLARRNLELFPDEIEAIRLAMDTELSIGDQRVGLEHMQRLASKFPNRSGVASFGLNDEGEIPQEFLAAIRGDDPALEIYEALTLPIHLSANHSVTMRMLHLSTVSNGISCNRLAPKRAINHETVGEPIFIDITAAISSTRLGLWPALKKSGMSLHVPSSVFQSIRREKDELNLRRVRGVESRKATYRLVVSHPNVISIHADDASALPPGKGPFTLKELNDHVAFAREAEPCISFATEPRSVWSVPKLIQAARDHKLLTANKALGMVEAFQAAFAGARWDGEPPDGPFPIRILLSGADLDALTQITDPSPFLDLFKEVLLGPGTFAVISRLLGPAAGIEETYYMAQNVFDRLQNGIEEGWLTLGTELRRPDCDEPRYLLEICKETRDSQANLWADDSALRNLFLTEAPERSSASTLEIVELLHGLGALAQQEVNDLGVELLKEGYRDVTWVGCLKHAALIPAHHSYFEVLVRRLCCGLMQGLHTNGNEAAYHAEILQQNLQALARIGSESEPWLRKATEAALGFAGKHTLGVWLALFDGLAHIDGLWIANYVEWAAQSAEKSGAFAFRTFIRAAQTQANLARGLRIIERGRDLEAFMRVWRTVRARRAGTFMMRIDNMS